MTDTLIIDAAFSALSARSDTTWGDALAVLRAALPWDLPAERLEARIAALKLLYTSASDYKLGRMVIDEHRADPIMRELYPEQFK